MNTNPSDNQSSGTSSSGGAYGGAIQKNLSVRPKVRNSNSLHFFEKKVNYEPLDKKMVSFIDQHGVKKSIPLISKEFNLMINCVTYYEPSFEEFNNVNSVTLHTWIMNCKKFENMLLNLVNISYFRFWSVIAFNADVHSALESYLSKSIRPYRLHPLLKNNDIKPVLSNIHRLVLKVYVRLLISKESEKNYLSESYHSEILISRNLLDISNIFNLLQLYGYGANSEMLKLLLKPFVQKSLVPLKTVCDEIGQLFARYTNDAATAATEDDNYEPDSNLNNSFDLENDSLFELYNMVSNVTDILFALNKLVVIEPEVTSVYSQSGLAERLVGFYGKYVPFIEKKCAQLFHHGKIVENLYKFYKCQISLAQSSGLLLFHHLLKNVFIDSLLNQNNTDKYQSFDALFNVLNLIINEKRFCYDYFTKFLFEKEFEPLLNKPDLNEQLNIDDVMVYYSAELRKIIADWNKNVMNYKNESSSYTINNNPDKVNGLITLAYEPPQTASSQSNTAKQESEVDDIRMDPETTMKEEMIKEMFPEFGDGFIYKVLEYFQFNNERVIDAILECNLPPELESLNRQFKKSDLIAAKRLAAAASSSSLSAKTNLPPDQPRPIDKYDPTATKHLELSQIYIGKKDKIGEATATKDQVKDRTIQLMEKIQDEEEEARENVKTLIERGKLDKAELKTNIDYIGLDLYDDEFDDTYVKEENFEIFGLEDESDSESDNEEIGASENLNQQQFVHRQQNNLPQDSRQPNQFKHNNAEKQGNFARYNKKQLYSKRNFNRQQHSHNNNKSGNATQTPLPEQLNSNPAPPPPPPQSSNHQKPQANNFNNQKRANNNNNQNRYNGRQQEPPPYSPQNSNNNRFSDQQQNSNSNQSNNNRTNSNQQSNQQKQQPNNNRPKNTNNNNSRKFHNNTRQNNSQQNRKN